MGCYCYYEAVDVAEQAEQDATEAAEFASAARYRADTRVQVLAGLLREAEAAYSAAEREEERAWYRETVARNATNEARRLAELHRARVLADERAEIADIAKAAFGA